MQTRRFSDKPIRDMSIEEKRDYNRLAQARWRKQHPRESIGRIFSDKPLKEMTEEERLEYNRNAKLRYMSANRELVNRRRRERYRDDEKYRARVLERENSKRINQNEKVK